MNEKSQGFSLAGCSSQNYISVIPMRLLEILIIITMLLLSIQWFLPSTIGKKKRGTIMGAISIIGIIITLLHATIEGIRWQMIPLYIPTILLYLWGVFKLVKIYRMQTGAIPEQDIDLPRKKLGAAVLIISIALVSTTLVIDSILPVFVLPQPSGDYPIGTVTFGLTDDTRNETFTDAPNDHRRILIKAWYPAEETVGYAMAPYVDSPAQFSTGIQRSWGFPPIMTSHFALIKTHSFVNAPLSQASPSYPVVIFSHGYGGLIMQNTVLMEELASNGYIVFSISHSYEAAVTSFPDGSVIYESNDTYSDIPNSLQIWANDTVFLLNQLEIADNTDIPALLHDGMDLTTIGVFGHSFGGTTAEEVALKDARFDVGISFDSPHGAKAEAMNMTKPFMLLFGPDFGNPEMDDPVYLNSNSTCYGLYVNGTRHHNFADENIWSPMLRNFGLLGSIDGHRMLQLLNDYVLAFFNEHLKGITSPLLDGPSATYPEVIFYGKNLS
jgi:predicted dienelactone hydrolase